MVVARIVQLLHTVFGARPSVAKRTTVVVCSVDVEVVLLSQYVLADVSVLANLPVDHFA